MNCAKRKTYTFDHAFGPDSDTQTLFDSAIEQEVWRVLEGFNVNVLCYGQTGSGKSHTLFGNGRESIGVVQMALETIFAYIEATPEREFLVRVAYFEIYNEAINDLCSDRKNLSLVENLKALFRWE